MNTCNGKGSEHQFQVVDKVEIGDTPRATVVCVYCGQVREIRRDGIVTIKKVKGNVVAPTINVSINE